MKIKLIYLLFFLLFVIGCKESVQKTNKPLDENELKEPLMNANQEAVRLEDEDIDLYIKRQQMNAIRTETGLRYQITKQGNGKLIKNKDIVTLSFQTFSINGELLYSSDKSGEKVMEIDKNNEIQALDEMLKMLNVGAEAHMVIPSHLAYGLAGDGDKIRQRIPIVMKIKVLKVKNSSTK